MKRCIVVLLLCAGCGSSNPADSPEAPGPQVAMESIRMADFDAYVALMQRTFASIYVMIDEFTSISQGWVNELVSEYWTRQYTLNLLTRLRLVQEQARHIRPEEPHLRQVHAEYEQALAVYGEAYQLFLDQVSFLDMDAIDQINRKLAEGNVHLIRFQFQLSDLGGRDILFGR